MEPISMESVELTLENKDLWDKFNTLGTEMVITKSGRRMFPYLQVSVKGLHPDEIYMVLLDITKVDDRRYKFNENDNQWQVVDSRVLFPAPVGMYVHPLCPCRGSALSKELLTFNKAKLTNNPHTVSFGHILLESMGRYIPRLSIVAYQDYQNQRWEKGVAFMFEETEFIAVTAYMNKEITKLKINNNPFARAFRENGLKGKGLQSDSTSSEAKGLEFQRDQTSENSTKPEELMAITYINQEGGSDDDGIQVFHINPSSIIVTDVLPSIPSASSVMTSPELPSSPTIPPTSERTNVVFEPVTTTTDRTVNIAHSSSYEEAENGLDSLLYPREPLQSITVEINQFVSEGKPGSSHVWATGNTGGDDDDILCKVIDVRSIRETPHSSLEQDSDIRTLKSSLECGDNMECLSEENEKVNPSSEKVEEGKRTKFLKHEENDLAEVGKVEKKEKKAFDRGNEIHIDQVHHAEYWDAKGSSIDNSAPPMENAIELPDTSKDEDISSSEKRVIDIIKETDVNDLTLRSDENMGKGNADEMEVEERNMGKEEGRKFDEEKEREKEEEEERGMDEEEEIKIEDVEETQSLDSVNTSLEKVQEKQLDKETGSTHEENNNSQGIVKKEPSKPQISKLLHFVNSVPMPALKFGTEKAPFSSHHNDSVFQPGVEIFNQVRLRKRSRKWLKSLENSNNAGQSEDSSKSVDQSDERSNAVSHSSDIYKPMVQSEDPLKSVDQSDKRSNAVSHSSDISKPKGQSEDSLKSVDQSDKRSNAVSHSSDISNPKGQSEDPLKSMDKSNKRSIAVSHSSDISKPMGQSEDSLKSLDQPQKRLKSGSHSSGILESVVQSNPRKGKGIPTTVINVGYEEPLRSPLPYELPPKLHQNPRKTYPDGKEGGPALQGINQLKCSKVTKNEDPSCLGASNRMQQDGASVGSTSTEGLPVILNSYSIQPSNFSNRQSIDLCSVSETRLDAQSHKNRVPIAYPAENFYQDTNPNKEVVERCPNKADPTEHQKKNGGCSVPEGTNVNYRKIVPKPSNYGSPYTSSKHQEFIDLNSSMSSKMYPRQTDGHDYLASKGVPLQVVYTFETKMSLSRAPDPRLPEEYNPTRTTFTGYASNLICSAPPIAITNKRISPPAQSAKYY